MLHTDLKVYGVWCSHTRAVTEYVRVLGCCELTEQSLILGVLAPLHRASASLV